MGKFKLLPLLLALLVLAALPVRGADYDPQRRGSVTVTLGKETPVAGAELTVHLAGRARPDAYTLVYTPTEAFAGISLENREDLARDLALRAEALPGLSRTTDDRGQAVFPDLEPGLYLVTQTEKVRGYLPIAPFVVEVPMSRDGDWDYDPEARPKVAPEPKPTTPGGGGGGKPPLIQTGQLNWPIPVLAVSGILLFSIGWSLCCLRGKRR